MGRWGSHPMQSDKALDNRLGVVEVIYDEMDEENKDIYYEDKEEFSKRMKKYLENISDLEIIKNRVNEDNLFVIPYTFLEFKAIPKEGIVEDLRECIYINSEFGLYEVDDIIRAHSKYFSDHFDKIIKQEIHYDSKGKGLLDTINE